MHQLRCFFAVLFAILIASPVCCCAAMVKKTEAPAQHACCGHSDSRKKEKHQDDCSCTSKTPRMVEAHPAVPHAPAFLAPEVLTFVSFFSKPEIPFASVNLAVEEIDTGPPKRRLALLQRFLI